MTASPVENPQWPLTPATPRHEGVERRTNSRALEYWKRLSGTRRFPRRADTTAESAGTLWDNLFIVEIAPDPGACRFLCAGAVLRTALDRDPTGATLAEVLSGGMGTRTQFFLQAAVGLKAPVTDDVSSWTRNDGTELLYRLILLPLSDDGEKVDALLGAFSYRVVSHR